MLDTAVALPPCISFTLDLGCHPAAQVRAACIPAANGHFTARGLAQFYAMLAAGGSWDGLQLLRSGAVDRMSEFQVSQDSTLAREPTHWALGFHKYRCVPR